MLPLSKVSELQSFRAATGSHLRKFEHGDILINSVPRAACSDRYLCTAAFSRLLNDVTAERQRLLHVPILVVPGIERSDAHMTTKELSNWFNRSREALMESFAALAPEKRKWALRHTKVTFLPSVEHLIAGIDSNAYRLRLTNNSEAEGAAITPTASTLNLLRCRDNNVIVEARDVMTRAVQSAVEEATQSSTRLNDFFANCQGSIDGASVAVLAEEIRRLRQHAVAHACSRATRWRGDNHSEAQVTGARSIAADANLVAEAAAPPPRTSLMDHVDREMNRLILSIFTTMLDKWLPAIRLSSLTYFNKQLNVSLDSTGIGSTEALKTLKYSALKHFRDLTMPLFSAKLLTSSHAVDEWDWRIR